MEISTLALASTLFFVGCFVLTIIYHVLEGGIAASMVKLNLKDPRFQPESLSDRVMRVLWSHGDVFENLALTRGEEDYTDDNHLSQSALHEALLQLTKGEKDYTDDNNS